MTPDTTVMVEGEIKIDYHSVFAVIQRVKICAGNFSGINDASVYKIEVYTNVLCADVHHHFLKRKDEHYTIDERRFGYCSNAN